MIVKNEEKFLSKCIDSVRKIISEIIIVDTGSTDKTVEIANGYSAKVYNYEWNDNFAEARNFAISKASSDWVLLLDADEEVIEDGCEKILNFINKTSLDGCNFVVYNYTGNDISSEYTVHNAFRLLRNNGKYKFKGEIHEQIVRKDNKGIVGLFAVSDIVIKHYGYLNSVINEKKKRDRNIPIILKQLELEPENAFYLFNLGNEYLAKQDVNEALKIYNKAMNYADVNQPYAPHLFYRRLTCLMQLKRYEEAITAANQALNQYPKSTDFEYLKGTIYFECSRLTLAIDSFNKCIEMGEPPSYLKFLSDCCSFKPYIALGEIYENVSDYDKAIDFYNKALNSNKDAYYILYTIGSILKKQYKDGNIVADMLLRYFSAKEYVPNLILLTDILINLDFYDIAELYADKILGKENSNVDGLFLKAKVHFYKKKYHMAYEGFMEVQNFHDTENILANIRTEGLQYLVIIALLQSDKDITSVLNLIKEKQEHEIYKIYRQIYCLHAKLAEDILTGDEDAGLVLQTAVSFLDKLLKVQEYDLFNDSVDILNKINSNQVLINLGKIYNKNGLKDLATKTILQSIEELKVVDRECINILYQTTLL